MNGANHAPKHTDLALSCGSQAGDVHYLHGSALSSVWRISEC